MKKSDRVYHEGVVIAMNDYTVSVKIVSRSACADCHAKSMCSAADMSEKIIEARVVDAVKTGDRVTVVMEEVLGWIAVVLSFLLPLIIMVTTLALVHTFTGDELRAAVSSLLALIPYYFVLSLFRKRISKRFIFKAEKC